jgi:hypothetical protein
MDAPTIWVNPVELSEKETASTLLIGKEWDEE